MSSGLCHVKILSKNGMDLNLNPLAALFIVNSTECLHIKPNTVYLYLDSVSSPELPDTSISGA